MAARMPRRTLAGVHIGTAEIYNQVEQMDGIAEAI